jgi:hypothetical protein
MDDIFIHDRVLKTTTRVSLDIDGKQFNSPTMIPVISEDGQYVTFAAFEGSIYYHNRNTGQTKIISTAYPWSPSISGNGRYVAYHGTFEFSSNDNLWTEGIIVQDMKSGLEILASISSDGDLGSGEFPIISSDGLNIAFHSASTNLINDDSNGFQDIFVHQWKGINITYIPVTLN